MKKNTKISCVFIACVIILLSFSSCKAKNIEDYSAEILYSKELPNPQACYDLMFRGKSVIANPVWNNGEFLPERSKQEKFPLSLYGSRNIAKLLSMTLEEYNQAFYGSATEYEVYEDATVYRIFVPEDTTYNNIPVTHAGKSIFIASDSDGKIYLFETSSWAAKTIIRNNYYNGRIGNIYYDVYGYYNFSTHEYIPYSSESDFPAFPKRSVYTSYMETLKSHQSAKQYFEGKDEPYTLAAASVGDRFYVMFSFEIANFLFVGEADTSGCSLYSAMFDNATLELLYLERIDVKDYLVSSAEFYYLTDSGKLISPYVKN